MVVREVQLSAHSYEALGVVGLNGVGKSTLLRAITGTCQVLGGKVLLFGRDVTFQPVYERIRQGLRSLPQEHRLFRTLTVRDNYELAQGGLGRDSAATRVTRKNLSSLYKRQAGTLSGGEQARLALDLITIGAWAVLLLDEPTTGLDSTARADLMSQIRSWSKEGKTIIFVEHDFDFVIEVSTYAYIVTPETTIAVGTQDMQSGRTLLRRVIAESDHKSNNSIASP